MFGLPFEEAAKLGLGVVLALLMFGLLLLIIKKILSNVDKDRKTYVDLLDKKDKIITNHLGHINKSMTRVSINIAKQEVSLNQMADKIVTAIENQTDMMKDTLPCVKRGGSDNES